MVLEIGFSAKRQDTEQRAMQSLLQRGDILLQSQHLRIYAIGHPACQCKTGGPDCLGCHQRMIQTAEAHADHQYHRQIQYFYQIRPCLQRGDRRQKSADTFDDNDIRFCAKFAICLLNNREVNFRTCLLRGDMRGNR